MNTELIYKAKEYAFHKHDFPSGSQRYGNSPYSAHLEMVVAVAEKYIHYISEEKRENVFVSCLCHDIIEDSDTTLKNLTTIFNKEVADIVYRVSNERGMSHKEILFKTMPKIWQSDLATFVKLCDRIANGTNSKKGEDEKASRVYARYLEEYPIFRYALKTDLYVEMWKELDLIFNYQT